MDARKLTVGLGQSCVACLITDVNVLSFRREAAHETDADSLRSVTAEPACNAVQRATASLAFMATVAL